VSVHTRESKYTIVSVHNTPFHAQSPTVCILQSQFPQGPAGKFPSLGKILCHRHPHLRVPNFLPRCQSFGPEPLSPSALPSNFPPSLPLQFIPHPFLMQLAVPAGPRRHTCRAPLADRWFLDFRVPGGVSLSSFPAGTREEPCWRSHTAGWREQQRGAGAHFVQLKPSSPPRCTDR